MAKYRKKPVTIEAVQFLPKESGARSSFDAMPKWLEDAFAAGVVAGAADAGNEARLRITTLEGPIHASPGDWTIRGVQGELYACKPDIFADTYEPAE